MAAVNPNLALQDISFTNMGNIWFEHSVVGESYGRRFIAHLGAVGSETHQQSEKVIFNDLFKKARKLAKEASNDKERAQVKELIGKLIGIEASAKTAYKDRSDCIYKFRSFFHRLFGGAFSGSHIKRLEKLQKKVECSVGKEDFRPAQENVQKNFQVFLSYLQLKGSLKIGDYTFSRSEALDRFVIHKKGSSRNIVCYYDHHAFKMEYEGKTETPKILDEVCHRAMQKIYKETTKINTCRWTNRSEIMLLEAGLKEIPLFHLDAFCERTQESFTIKFLNDDLTASEGSDSGGLSRAYISGLAQGVCFSKSLFAGAFGLPKPSPKAIDQGVIPSCTPEESRHYHNLGNLLEYCLSTDLIKTGQCLSDGVYEAMHLLTGAQIRGAVTDLDRATCIAMAQAILPRIDKKTTNISAQVMGHLALLAKETLEEADFQGLMLEGCDDFLNDDLEVDWEKVQLNPEGFKNHLFRSIFSNHTLINELGGISIGTMISGIHSIAQGLIKNWQPGAKDWQEDYGVASWQDLKKEIQGSFDKQLICNSIRNPYSALEASVKVQWLKEWIQEEATEDEITAFLRYVTGAPCLPPNQSISVYFNQIDGLSNAHTCAMSLELSNGLGPDALDGTKEGFIAGLKDSINMLGFNRL